MPRGFSWKSSGTSGRYASRRFLFFDGLIQPVQGVGQAAQLVDEAQLHRLLPIEDAAHVGGQLVGAQHQPGQVLPGDVAVSGDEADDALLHPLEVVKSLGRADDQAGQPHRVYRHGGGGGDKGPPGRHRQGHADGVAAPQHQGGSWLRHGGDQLRDGQPCLHVSPGVVQQALYICIFIVIYGRMIEIYLVTSVAPLPMAAMIGKEWGGMGQNYLRSLLALGFQAFLIIVCVAIYAVLVQNIALEDDIIMAIWSCVGYTVLLCFTLFKTGSLAKSVFQAH